MPKGELMRKRRTRRALLGMGAAGLAAGTVVLSSAAAGEEAAARDVIGTSHGLKYAFEQETITASDPFVVVNCPGATAPTGGGTFIETEDPVEAQITNSTPQPAGDPNQKPDEGWLSEGRLAPMLGSTSLLAYAICSDRPSKLRYRSEAKFVPAGQTDSVAAECPNGTALTGGGALTDSDLGDMILPVSRPDFPGRGDPRGWAAVAHNYDNVQHSLVAYAICSKEKDKYSYRVKGVDIPDGTPGSAHQVVRCPKRRAVSGGGAEIFGGITAGDAWLTVSSPQPAGDPNKAPKKGWIAEGISYEEETLDVWAICKK
jgi:hypothetical protein